MTFDANSRNDENCRPMIKIVDYHIELYTCFIDLKLKLINSFWLKLIIFCFFFRDLVHRQIASATIQHLSLGVFGFGCEDALTHLLNLMWPNIFETSPHVVQAVIGAIEGLRVSLGPNKILQYALQGLFHPARKVRDVYWRIYNTLYIGGQDALVAGYPRVPDDEKNTYSRHQLSYFL